VAMISTEEAISIFRRDMREERPESVFRELP
jgi:hypothetical protein